MWGCAAPCSCGPKAKEDLFEPEPVQVHHDDWQNSPLTATSATTPAAAAIAADHRSGESQREHPLDSPGPRLSALSAGIGLQAAEVLNVFSSHSSPNLATGHQESYGSHATSNRSPATAMNRPAYGERRPLKASDLKLSCRLTKDLGLDDLDQMAEEATGSQVPGALRTFWLLHFVKTGMSRFRSRFALVAEPTHIEVDRGVQIEGVYDFYTVADKKVRTRRMTEKVFHHRRTVAGEDDGNDESFDDEEVLLTKSMSAKSTTSSSSSYGLPDGKRTESGNSYERRRLSSEQEVLAHWGVLVGKAMHMRVIDFTAVADKFVYRRKYQDFTRRKGRIIASVRERARAVVQQAWELAKTIGKEPVDKFDHEWQDESLLTHLFSRHYVDMLTLFCNTACKILAVQPTLVDASAPCKVFGDIHGQFRDLLLFFRAFGAPDEHDAPNFVFNGDFVDRGEHQLEVIGLLLALKVLLPEKVWLVRGNHEDRYMSKRYGFQDECRRRLGGDGPKLFELFHKTFSLLPLACVVAKRVLVVHGGIGDGQWTLADLQAVKRPLGDDHLQDPDKAWIWNLMWSDPIEDDDDREGGVFGVHESPRGGISTQFGWNVTKMFCARNGLSLVVRSHQSKADSLGFDIMHENLLIRVFSARDYEGHGNDGSVLLIRSTDETQPDSLLTVRPQVVRSTTKAVQEEIARTGRLTTSGASSGGQVMKLLKGQQPRAPRRRKRRARSPDRSGFDDEDAGSESGSDDEAGEQRMEGTPTPPEQSAYKSDGSGKASEKGSDGSSGKKAGGSAGSNGSGGGKVLAMTGVGSGGSSGKAGSASQAGTGSGKITSSSPQMTPVGSRNTGSGTTTQKSDSPKRVSGGNGMPGARLLKAFSKKKG